MSSPLIVYLVNIAATPALVGPGDDQLLEVARDDFGDALAARRQSAWSVWVTRGSAVAEPPRACGSIGPG